MNDLTPITAIYGALARLSECPLGWTPKPEQAMPILDGLKEASIWTIGRSAGGREIHAIAYGEKEPLRTTTDNLHGAIDASSGAQNPMRVFPEAFYGSTRRTKPVLALKGGIHGGELTGTVASINLCAVIETGRDLRGKAWPKLQALARDARILIIPWLNIDGVTRWPLANPTQAVSDLYQLCLQGIAKDGTRYAYPDSASMLPIPPETTAFMGSYFNDAGMNLVYDFPTIRRQPETIAWMELFLDERPDGVVVWHCNAGSMIGPADYYIPPGFQIEIERIGGTVRHRLLDEGFNIGRTGNTLPGYGRPSMWQTAGIYHVCGALPFMCELPYGIVEYPYTCDQMIDIGLLTIEEILVHAHRDGLRPHENWASVRRRQLEAAAKAGQD